MSSSPTPAPGYGFELNSHKDPFVLPTVAAVFIFILLVLILWVLTLLFLKRFFCADGGATFSTNQVQRVHLNEVIFQDPSMQFHSHGPESSIMHSPPITQFKKKNGEESRPSNNECAVCLGEFQEGEWLKQLPNCTHVFHIACIDTWLQSHSNCPLCRSHVVNLSLDHECSVSMHTLLDAPRREDFFQERAARYQVLRLEILQNLAL